ncbi:MAG: tellurium resistance protein TerC [Candidatus Angelobacter sp. Gp1-AA117]|nr:MAG: tellurium resistance protein TerC [Candidatus Angelobacter sp. Gp1-AA117]
MLIFWIIFNAVILVLLFVDLAVLNREGRVVSFKQALVSSAIWIALALAFAVIIYQWMGAGKSLEFITGYLVEEALSVDNLFVFILLFSYFKVPPEQERTVLFWGIIGALVMRGVFIVAGVALVNRFHWLLYLFGAFLIYTGYNLMREGDEEQVDPSKNFVLRMARKFLPVTTEYEGKKFLTIKDGRKFATPLFIVLLVVETTDILFATDSIPAILAISRDSFIVYTSNVFAILGLRSLFFALSGMMKLFHYLNYGLAVVLMFIGAKMIAGVRYHIPTWIALLVIAVVLAISVLASVMFPKKEASN